MTASIAICSFCLFERPLSALRPLGSEIDREGKLRHQFICVKCDTRLAPPQWVAADPLCARLWFENADWRLNAQQATGHPQTERYMVQLVHRAAGGSEGEAVG